MTVFEFTLKFSRPETGADPQSYVDQLGAAGCDDAVIGVGQTGRIAVEFAREAESAFDAVSSAIDDVKKAVPLAKLIEVTPDLVGMTDVAENPWLPPSFCQYFQ